MKLLQNWARIEPISFKVLSHTMAGQLCRVLCDVTKHAVLSLTHFRFCLFMSNWPHCSLLILCPLNGVFSEFFCSVFFSQLMRALGSPGYTNCSRNNLVCRADTLISRLHRSTDVFDRSCEAVKNQRLCNQLCCLPSRRLFWFARYAHALLPV